MLKCIKHVRAHSIVASALRDYRGTFTAPQNLQKSHVGGAVTVVGAAHVDVVEDDATR
jgi:hypothetical protein